MQRRDDSRQGWRRGALTVLGLQAVLLLVAAILFPIFAKAESYSGPGMSTRRVANELGHLYAQTGRWTTAFEELRPLLRRLPLRTFEASFMRLTTKGDEAEYLIGVNGSVQRWHVGSGGGPDLVEGAVALGKVGVPR